MTENSMDQDNLSAVQEYTIAGIVLLLFGLLYWFLNQENTTSADILQPQKLSETSLIPERDNKTSSIQTGLISPTPPVSNNTIPAITQSASWQSGAEDTTTTVTSTTPVETPAAIPADTQPTALMQAEIERLQAENAVLKQAETARLQMAQIAQQPAAATSDTQSATQQANAPPSYTLPDGSTVTLAPNGFEPALRDTIRQQVHNTPLVFDNIQFDSGSTSLHASSEHQLKAVAALLHQNPNIKVMLRGHSDDIGQAANNAQLSLLRANSVGLALVNLGIDRQRIRIMGMGASLPLESNATEAGRQKNRRIDISIIE